MKKTRNHYDNLKVDRTASHDDIRKAYRRLASLHHPDRNGGSEESIRAMQCINSAYEVLLDAKARATHDAWIDLNEGVSRQHTWEKASSEEKFRPRPYAPERAPKAHSAKDSSPSSPDFDFKRYRPANFDDRHYDEFVKYNHAMRLHMFAHDITDLTPEVVYRAFVIDKQWGRGAPTTMLEAWKAHCRAMDRPEQRPFDRIAGLYFNRDPALQGALFAFAYFLLVFVPALWFIAG